MMILNSLISIHSTTIIENPNQRKSQHASRSILAKKKYKIVLTKLTKRTLSPYSFMLVTVEKEKHGDFVADIAFFSSSDSDVTKDIESIKESELADVIGKYSFRTFRIRGNSRFVMDITINGEQEGQQQHNHGDFVADIAFFSSSDSDVTKDIESIKESGLADVIKKYRIFVECIKTAEQKELSRTSKNAFKRIDLRSIIQHLAHGLTVSGMKKTMITNGTYVKDATLNTVKIRKIISEFSELKNNSVKRDIYTRINVSGTLVTTRSTIELDADIVSVIQKQPEVTNLTIRNFILNIHGSNVSFSTFFLLNKVNEIFSNCRMIIGFGRMATTPVSIHNMLLISLDPLSIVYAAVPTGLFVLIPRIARLIIRHRIRKTLYFSR